MKKLIIWLVVVVLVVFAGWWAMFGASHSSPTEQTNQNTNQQQQGNPPPPPASSDSGNTWRGTLQNSDDARRGNLMLKLDSSSTVVYMRTSRDFNSLIGKNVTVSYEGSLDSFKLLDIQPQ